MLRTQLRVRANDGTYKLVDAIAACKVAGYTFLIHRSITQPNDKFAGTYAPIGIGVTQETSIENVIARLVRYAAQLDSAIKDRIGQLAKDHIPQLAPEEGIQTDDWKYREQCRFVDGEYQAVPSVQSLEYPIEHYLHLSTTKTESDFVAYTPSESYGKADRQVRLKFGKYLKKTFEHLTDQEIQSAVIALRARLALAESPATLQFTTDRDRINEIFETEMYACDSSYTSCMHGKFEGREHRPYHVYANSPDVAVAYVVERGSIVARPVVSTKDKQWIRAYSVKQNDSTYCRVLSDLLEREGYREGTLMGNRLSKLPTCKVSLPYIDHGGMGVIDCGKYWEVCDGDEGEYVADQTDGTATERTARCERCDYPEDECECSYCECCEESFNGGCDSCSMCEQCARCIEHDACQCARCSECNRIIDPSNRYIPACNCDRCSECGELESGCDCVKCSECNRLESDCECEPNEQETDTETETAEVTV